MMPVSGRGRLSWILTVIDIPIYDHSTYLSLSDLFTGRGGLGAFYALIQGGNTG